MDATAVKVQITVKDGTGYLSSVPGEALDALRQATSFRPAGYQFSQAFKRKRWDGWIRLVRHGKFPAGLLPRVMQVLDEFGVEYELAADTVRADKPSIDARTAGVERRWYQDAAVEAALLNPRGVIRAPTGSGKTPIAARIIASRGKRALVIVPTIDLLHQVRGFLQKHLVVVGDPEIGQLGDGQVNPRSVTVATIRTAAKAMNVAYERYEWGEYDDSDDTDVDAREMREWVESVGTLIVDEAHILGADVVYNVATKMPAPNKYGMSASPWRDDGADLMIEAATGPRIYRVGTKELVADGHLVPPIIRTVSTEGWWAPAAWGSGDWADCYRHEIVENAERNRRIAAIVNDEVDVPAMVLVKQVKHGRTLEKLIPGSLFLSGSKSGEERTDAYDRLRSGELRVIICTSIADMGLDLPILGALVLAGGGKSSTRHLQRIGRVARPYPGKRSALVIDFDDGHVHRWFAQHYKARRKIERAEWKDSALWI